MGSKDKPSASDTYSHSVMESLAAVSLILTLSGFASCLTSVPGIPGQDYPTLDFYNLPDTSFACGGRVNGGFYSDEEAFCQMYHMCVAESTGSFKKFSFLCPNGTIFNQEKLVCDAWFNVDCSEDTIANDATALELLDAERTFISLGLESDEPEKDYPWRFRSTE